MYIPEFSYIGYGHVRPCCSWSSSVPRSMWHPPWCKSLHQATINQFGVDRCQYLHTRLMLFDHTMKVQDGAHIGQAFDSSIQMRKLAVQRGVVQRIFHGRTRMPGIQLQQVNVQHHLCSKQWSTHLARWRIHCNQSQQLSPRNQQIHLINEITLARALCDHLESGVG